MKANEYTKVCWRIQSKFPLVLLDDLVQVDRLLSAMVRVCNGIQRRRDLDRRATKLQERRGKVAA
jgi:hypothetical protein